jgi:hypothetical protein
LTKLNLALVIRAVQLVLQESIAVIDARIGGRGTSRLSYSALPEIGAQLIIRTLPLAACAGGASS